MRPHTIRAATVLLAVAFLAGCASDEPAVCQSLDAVQTSFNQVRNTNVSENGLAKLSTDLQQLQTNVDQLVADAQSQYASEIAAVKSSADSVKSTVTAVQSNPTAAGLTQVRTAVAGLGDTIGQLDQAMSDTC